MKKIVKLLFTILYGEPCCKICHRKTVGYSVYCRKHTDDIFLQNVLVETLSSEQNTPNSETNSQSEDSCPLTTCSASGILSDEVLIGYVNNGPRWLCRRDDPNYIRGRWVSENVPKEELLSTQVEKLRKRLEQSNTLN